jgi:hypothetical protein
VHHKIIYVCVQLDITLILLFYLKHLYMFRAFLAHHQEILYCLVSRSLWQTVIQSTVGPRFTNVPVYEQFGLRTNFPSQKRLGLRMVSRIKNTIWQQRQTESISAGVSCW